MNGDLDYAYVISPDGLFLCYLLLMFMSCQVILAPALPSCVRGEKILLCFIFWLGSLLPAVLESWEHCSHPWVTKEKWNVKVEAKFISWTQTLPIRLATAFLHFCMPGRVLDLMLERTEKICSQLPNAKWAFWIALMWLLIRIYQRTSGYFGHRVLDPQQRSDQVTTSPVYQNDLLFPNSRIAVYTVQQWES